MKHLATSEVSDPLAQRQQWRRELEQGARAHQAAVGALAPERATREQRATALRGQLYDAERALSEIVGREIGLGEVWDRRRRWLEGSLVETAAPAIAAAMLELEHRLQRERHAYTPPEDYGAAVERLEAMRRVIGALQALQLEPLESAAVDRRIADLLAGIPTVPGIPA
jgi:hypothetical protein